MRITNWIGENGEIFKKTENGIFVDDGEGAGFLKIEVYRCDDYFLDNDGNGSTTGGGLK